MTLRLIEWQPRMVKLRTGGSKVTLNEGQVITLGSLRPPPTLIDVHFGPLNMAAEGGSIRCNPVMDVDYWDHLGQSIGTCF
jgi:hypothetical protein